MSRERERELVVHHRHVAIDSHLSIVWSRTTKPHFPLKIKEVEFFHIKTSANGAKLNRRRLVDTWIDSYCEIIASMFITA
jgi:hypothetical protein